MGRLLIFEGMDSAGKTTSIQRLLAEFSQLELVYTPRKPGSKSIDQSFEDWLIAKLVTTDKVLVLDRSVLSNIAYNAMRALPGTYNAMQDLQAYCKLRDACDLLTVILLRMPRAYEDEHIKLTHEQDAFLHYKYVDLASNLGCETFHMFSGFGYKNMETFIASYFNL